MNERDSSERGQPGYGDRGRDPQQSEQAQQNQNQPGQKQSSSGQQQQQNSTSSDQYAGKAEGERNIADYGGQASQGTEERDYDNPDRDQQGQQPGRSGQHNAGSDDLDDRDGSERPGNDSPPLGK